MRYACLVYGRESDLAALGAEGLVKLDRDSLAYDRSLQAAGKLLAAQALDSTTKSRLVRRRGGKALVTDGPFAETREQLLGFVLVEAADMEEALRIAADIPLAAIGSIEVRPVYVPGGA